MINLVQPKSTLKKYKGFDSLTSTLSCIFLHIHFYVLKCRHSYINCGYICEIVDINECEYVLWSFYRA